METKNKYRPHALYNGFGGASSILLHLYACYSLKSSTKRTKMMLRRQSNWIKSLCKNGNRNGSGCDETADSAMIIIRYRHRLMAACLALSCKDDPNIIHVEFHHNVDMVKLMTSLIRNDAVDTFIRECFVQCTCMMIFNLFGYEYNMYGDGDGEVEGNKDDDYSSARNISFSSKPTILSDEMKMSVDEVLDLCIDGSVVDTLIMVISASIDGEERECINIGIDMDAATYTYKADESLEDEHYLSSGLYSCSCLQPSLLAIRLLFRVIKNIFHNDEANEGKRTRIDRKTSIVKRVLNHLQSSGLLMKIISWVFLLKNQCKEFELGQGHRQIILESIAHTSITIQRDLCTIARHASEEEIETIWFRVMDEADILPKLIAHSTRSSCVPTNTCKNRSTCTKTERSVLTLITEIVDTILYSTILRSNTSSCRTFRNAIVRKILAKAYTEMMPLYHQVVKTASSSSSSEYRVRHVISALACIIMLENRRRTSQRRVSITQNNGSSRRSGDNETTIVNHSQKKNTQQPKMMMLAQSKSTTSTNNSFRSIVRSMFIENSLFIQILWGLLQIHGLNQDSHIRPEDVDDDWYVRTSTLVLQEITSGNLLSKALHPTYSDVLDLFQTGCIHVLLIVREQFQVVDGGMKEDKVVNMLDEILSSIIALFVNYISVDGREERQYRGLLEMCYKYHNEVMHIDSLILEEIFLLCDDDVKRKKRIQEERFIHNWLIQELKELLKPPWQQIDAIFLIIGDIMRIVNMMDVSKQDYTKRSSRSSIHTVVSNGIAQSLESIGDRHLFIEVTCADKIAPSTFLRSPPIEDIICNAPILAENIVAHITEHEGTPGSDSVIARIDATSYDAIEEYFCHLEFGTEYAEQNRHATDVKLCLQLIKIAHHFGSEKLVEEYVQACCDNLDCNFAMIVMDTMLEISHGKALILCIQCLLHDKKHFQSLMRFVSKQELFTAALLTIILAI